MTTFASPGTLAVTRLLAERYQRARRLRQWRADALTFLGWVSIAVAVALYLASGGLAKFTDLPGVLNQVGIIAGLVATDTCVLMVLLAARIPLVDRAMGHDRAIAAHRSLGAFTLLGLLAHGVFLTVGWALGDGVGVVEEFWIMWSVSDLMWAILGLAGLLLVGVTSFQAARRKLGHEVWHAIHLLTYAAIGASIPHQFSTGLFAEEGPQRWYWMGLFIVTGLLLVIFRLLLPVFVTWRHQMRVAAVVPCGPGTVSIHVSGRQLDRLPARAGQFFHWRFLGRGLWWHQHPFSLSAAPTPSMVRITVRNLGEGSARLQSVRVGTRVAVEGPYGMFSDAARTTERGLVLMGAGIGIAPIRAVLEETDVPAGRTTVLLRASHPEELYLVREIDAIARARGAELLVALGPRGDITPWLPESWQHLTLPQLAPQIATSDVYVCGPQAWTDQVVEAAREAGSPAASIHDERFAW